MSCSLFEARIIYLKEVTEEEVAEFVLQLPQSSKMKLLIPTSFTDVVVDSVFGVAQRGNMASYQQLCNNTSVDETKNCKSESSLQQESLFPIVALVTG